MIPSFPEENKQLAFKRKVCKKQLLKAEGVKTLMLSDKNL
jgi:hypothetical protein